MKDVSNFLNKKQLQQLFLKTTALLCALCIMFAPFLFADASVGEVGAAFSKSESASLSSFGIIPYDGGYFYRINFEKETAELLLGAKDVQKAEIPEKIKNDGVEYTVTSVSKNAFAQNAVLSELILPATVVHIGSGAFFGCVSLDNIKAEGLTSAGTDVFGGTPFITSSEFVTLGSVLFRYNGKSEAVKVPGGVTFVADAFAWNPFIKVVILSEGVLEIGNGAFAFSENLRTVSLPFSLEKIGNKAFFGCVKLNEISIASNVTSIGESAFSGTPFLSKLLGVEGDMIILGGGVLLRYKGNESTVAVPDGVVSVSDAFAYSPVKAVTLPDGCSIGDSAFKGASELFRVMVKGDCGGISAFAFDGCEKLTLLSFDGSFTGVVEKYALKDTSADLSVYYRDGAKGFELFESAGVSAVSPEKIK